MNKFTAGDKVVQQMTRDGAVEVNKATGGAEHISARVPSGGKPPDNSPGVEAVGGIVDRVQTERTAIKKRTAKKYNAEIFKRSQYKPEKKPQATTPKITSPTTGRVSDKPNGKNDTRLVFKERGTPLNGNLTHAVKRPGREAVNATHNEVKKHEGDNIGIQAAHFAERKAEGAARMTGKAYTRLKFEPQRKLLQAEKKAAKANVKAIYKRDLRTKPGLDKAGILKKAAHKRRIKRRYAQAFRQGNIKGAQAANRTARVTTKMVIGTALKLKLLLLKIKMLAIKAAKLLALTWKFFAVAGMILLMLIIFVSCFASCSAMFGGAVNTVVSTTFLATDEDIHGAHADYRELETALAERIANISTEFPNFDEYRFNLDPIGHDPFALISYLTARYLEFTQDQVQASLAALFARQYTLTLTPITEVRTRTETRTGTGTDPDGNPYTYTYTVTVQYNWYVLVVTLVNRGIETAALENLTPEQQEAWHIYMETRGNRPELFP